MLLRLTCDEPAKDESLTKGVVCWGVVCRGVLCGAVWQAANVAGAHGPSRYGPFQVPACQGSVARGCVLVVHDNTPRQRCTAAQQLGSVLCWLL